MNQENKTNYDFKDSYYDEYEIDLREYIMLLWENKWFIGGLFVVAVIAAGLFTSFYLTPVYETSTVLYAPTLRQIDGSEIGPNDYLTFLKTSELSEKIIDEFNLGEENLNYSPLNLQNKLTIIRNDDSNNITLALTDSDPVKAKNILSSWSRKFILSVYNFFDNENQKYINRLEQLYLSTLETYNNDLNNLTKFKEQHNISLLKASVANYNNRIVNAEERLDIIDRSVGKLTAEKEEIDKQLTVTEKFTNEEQTVSEKSLRQLRELLKDNENLEFLTINNEQINQIYQDLVIKKNDIEQDLVSYQAEKKMLNEETERLKEELIKLNNQIALLEEERIKLDQKYQNSLNNYNSAESNYVLAKNKLQGIDYDLRVVSVAVEPVSPVSPNLKLNVAIVGVLALMLGVFIVFFKEFMQEEYEE